MYLLILLVMLMYVLAEIALILSAYGYVASVSPMINPIELGKSIADFVFAIKASAGFRVYSAIIIFFFVNRFIPTVNGISENHRSAINKMLLLVKEMQEVIQAIHEKTLYFLIMNSRIDAVTHESDLILRFTRGSPQSSTPDPLKDEFKSRRRCGIFFAGRTKTSRLFSTNSPTI